MTDDLVKRLEKQGVFWPTGLAKEAVDYIKKLEAANLAQSCIKVDDQMRIEKLEAALRSIAANACCDSCREAALVARKALEVPK